MTRLAALASILLVSACGGGDDDAPPLRDGGSADGGPPPGEVAAPALPVLTPCPDGWAATPTTDGFDVCEPPAGAGVASGASCPPGTARFVDAADCAPVGPACPPEPFPDASTLPPAARVIYVRDGALGGDGSTAVRPLPTIGDAMRSASTGTLIVVAKGEYAETLDVYAGVTVIGACTAETRIVPPAGTGPAAALHEPNGALARLTIVPGERPGVEITRSARLDEVIVDGALGTGILVETDAELEATRLALRDVRLAPGLGETSGIALGERATARISGLSIVGSGDAALLAFGPGGGFVVDGAVLADLGSTPTTGLTAVVAQEDTTVELMHALVVGARGALGAARGTGATLIVRDAVFRGRGDVVSRAGLLAGNHGIIAVERALFDRSGAYAAGAASGSSITLTDVAIRGPANEDVGTGVGAGVVIGPDSLGTIRRVHVADARNAGLSSSASGAGEGIPDGTRADFDVEDFVVARPNAEGHEGGYGIAIGDRTHGALRRVRISDVRGTGVLAGRDSEVEIEDLEVVGASAQASGRYGRAIEAQFGSHLTVERARVDRGTECAVLTFGAGADVQIRHALILDTQAHACTATGCPTAPVGIGVGAYGGATVRLEEFRIDGAPLCGVHLATDSQLDLADGLIRGTAVGACVQVEGYDLERITRTVRFEENDLNIDATAHEIPEGAPLEFSGL